MNTFSDAFSNFTKLITHETSTPKFVQEYLCKLTLEVWNPTHEVSCLIF